jgi:hypothetical protein
VCFWLEVGDGWYFLPSFWIVPYHFAC